MSDVVWGVHMGLQHGMKPVSEGYITLGWHEVGDLSAIPPTREAFKARIATVLPNRKPGAIPGDAGVLYRFSREMQLGDVIVFPCKVDKRVYIGRVQGGYEYDPAGLEYPNRRKVAWLRDLPRTAFSPTARHEIGSAISLFRVTTHADEFLAALTGEQPTADAADDSSAGELAAQSDEATEDFIISRLKSRLTSYEFEKFIAHLLTCMGYHARVTPPSGDGGVDVIAHRDELGFEQPIIKVQCKQTLNSIGRPDVSQLLGVLGAGEVGLFVTLGAFTPEAWSFERAKPNLRLIDRSALIALIANHYERFEPRYRVLLPLKRAYRPDIATADEA